MGSSGPGRVRVERGIYRQPNGKYAVCWRHAGRLHFRTVGFDLAEASRERLALIAATREEKVPVLPRVRFETAACLSRSTRAGSVSAWVGSRWPTPSDNLSLGTSKSPRRSDHGAERMPWTALVEDARAARRDDRTVGHHDGSEPFDVGAGRAPGVSARIAVTSATRSSSVGTAACMTGHRPRPCAPPPGGAYRAGGRRSPQRRGAGAPRPGPAVARRSRRSRRQRHAEPRAPRRTRRPPRRSARVRARPAPPSGTACAAWERSQRDPPAADSRNGSHRAGSDRAPSTSPSPSGALPCTARPSCSCRGTAAARFRRRRSSRFSQLVFLQV